jgi:hypothetical protein
MMKEIFDVLNQGNILVKSRSLFMKDTKIKKKVCVTNNVLIFDLVSQSKTLMNSVKIGVKKLEILGGTRKC